MSDDPAKLLISYCIPCGNRAGDLKHVMPLVIRSANNSPPVEILVLDYNSTDDLDDYMESLRDIDLAEGTTISYIKYNKGKYYHNAHARNLVSLAAKGEYIIAAASDIYLEKMFFSRVKKELKASQRSFLRLDSRTMVGIIVLKKSEFIEAGGYDERFDLYGSEDRDLNSRLERRGLEYGLIARKYLHTLKNPPEIKGQNYRLNLSKSRMTHEMAKIYQENVENHVLVANQGKAWGQI